MPALCSRKTKLAAEPSSTGTSSAVMSMARLSRPRPAQAESRCSMVCTLGAPGSPPALMRRGHARVAHRLRVDRDRHRLRQVGAAKDDAAVGRRRAQRQLDLLPAVHAHADGAGEGFQGALLQHGRDCPAAAKDRAPRALSRKQPPQNRLGRPLPPCGGAPRRYGGWVNQSACLRRNAGISISSMPLLASASTLAAACVRPWRQTLGVLSWL